METIFHKEEIQDQPRAGSQQKIFILGKDQNIDKILQVQYRKRCKNDITNHQCSKIELDMFQTSNE